MSWSGWAVKKIARQMLVERLHVLGDARLVAFDRQEVIGAPFLHDDAPGLGLGVQGVAGDQLAFQREPPQQLLRGGDFVGAFGNEL